MKGNSQPPQSVPVLTEVVVMPKKATPEVVHNDYPPFAPDPAYAETAPAPLGDWPGNPPPQQPPARAQADAGFIAPPLIDEAMLTQRVLADLDKQLDLMFEHRLRETLSPVLARMTDTLVREMRNQVAASLREMVTRAVALELDRLQRR
jgi:hypothetical protein